MGGGTIAVALKKKPSAPDAGDGLVLASGSCGARLLRARYLRTFMGQTANSKGRRFVEFPLPEPPETTRFAVTGCGRTVKSNFRYRFENFKTTTLGEELEE